MCVVCLLLAATSFAGTTTYIYDELNRLKEVQYGNGNGIRYEYDEIGNLRSKTPFGNVFTITASAGEGGSISPMGTVTITAGSSKTYSFTPLYGYRIANVVVDGISQGVIPSYMFSNLAANHTISASFAMISDRVGVYDPAAGQWYLDLNGNGQWEWATVDGLYTFGAGLTGAVPVTGDWTGTGTRKIGMYQNGTWYLDLNGNGVWDGTPTDGLYTFGTGIAGAVPVTGDWSGNGITKIGVYDPATSQWYLDYNGNGAWDGTPADVLSSFDAGLVGAVPVTGDWTGTGTRKIGMYQNGTWYLDLNGNGMWDGTPTDGLYTFGAGLAGAVPVTGDWNGNGITKIGVYDPTLFQWYLDYNGNGSWDGTPADRSYLFGFSGIVPVSGGW